MSNSRKSLLWIGTHLVAVAAGVLLFRPEATASKDAEHAASAVVPALSAAESGTSQAPAAGKAPTRPSSGPTASVHQLAWKALAHDGLTRPERMKASAVILRQWIQEDWQSALDTVMKETPDDFSVLLVEFEDLCAREPADIWSLIESKRYGVTTVTLRNTWQDSLRRLSEEDLRRVTEKLPESGKAAVLQISQAKARAK
jgi:hypothetical protein